MGIGPKPDSNPDHRAAHVSKRAAHTRAEVQLGSSKISLAANTGFTFLNLDDRTVQIQLSAGTINVSRN